MNQVLRPLEGPGDWLTALGAFPVSPTPTQVAAMLATLGIAYGSYTPTLTGVTNISSTESFQCSYVRIKDYVVFDGLFRAAKTATGAVAGTSLGISLPIASNFTNALDAHGVFMTKGQTEGGSIESDATNYRLSAVWTANNTTNRYYRFTGGYFIK